MRNKALVSIITPCYNSTKFIHRLLDSVLVQDYPSIEMLLIDDGSTDNLMSFLLNNNYFERFKTKGYFLKYFHQENKGQSAAINLGLKHYEGKYLTWPDSDDYYESNAILTFVNLFDEYENIGVVRCYSNHFTDENIKLEKFSGDRNNKYGQDNLFYDCLYMTENMFFGAGNYIVKSDALLSSMQEPQIYQHKLTGQNWQLLLPVLYNFDCFTTKQRLHNIYVRENSHSRIKSSILKRILVLEQHKRTIVYTLNNIKNITVAEKKEISKKIKLIYFNKKNAFLLNPLRKVFK